MFKALVQVGYMTLYALQAYGLWSQERGQCKANTFTDIQHVLSKFQSAAFLHEILLKVAEFHGQMQSTVSFYTYCLRIPKSLFQGSQMESIVLMVPIVQILRGLQSSVQGMACMQTYDSRPQFGPSNLHPRHKTALVP